MKLIIKLFKWLKTWFLIKVNRLKKSEPYIRKLNRKERREKDVEYTPFKMQSPTPKNNRKATRGRNYYFQTKSNEFQFITLKTWKSK